MSKPAFQKSRQHIDEVPYCSSWATGQLYLTRLAISLQIRVLERKMDAAWFERRGLRINMAREGQDVKVRNDMNWRRH